MNFARSFMPLIGWRRNIVRAFLALSDIAEQMTFWRKHLDTRRFRTGLDTLMSPVILRAVYASQFLPSLPSKFGVVLRTRLERGFGRHQNTSNPYARRCFLERAPMSRGVKRVIFGSCWQMQHPGWNHVLPAFSMASLFRTF
jgi:hypothetical protein